MRFIFTCREASRELTLYEFKRFDASFVFTRWLDSEVGLAETSLDRAGLPALIKAAPIIFVRHIFAVDDERAPEEIISAAAELCKTIPGSGAAVSVQARAGERPCAAQEGLAEQIGGALAGAGLSPDLKGGKHILSVYIGERSVYMGLGDAETNLSRWRGGMPFYSKSADYVFVSRAEFKLIEALESFCIPTDAVRSALDLGAAPGGWTKALADRGAFVTAVDPCPLDPSLRHDRRVKHYAMTAEHYLKLDTDERFDIITDDMKLDADKSLAIVKRFYSRLADGGYAIVTLKLEHGFCYKEILDCMADAKPFELVGARQLFHNRSEVTLVLRKPGAV